MTTLISNIPMLINNKIIYIIKKKTYSDRITIVKYKKKYYIL